ncbi:MAG: hypothetical protein HY670_01630 [Chloroflexi bacterium]|nr:hypothetical protein [Chloroflexota bacterium]
MTTRLAHMPGRPPALGSVAAPEAETKSDCCHYWVIETPNGANSRGVCRFCKAEKEFINSYLDFRQQQRA